MRQYLRMRAERLLRIVFLLQSRGRVTAGELADELEVSSRTIQRDMEALSGAGIPVYATRGGDGGWELLREYRTSLTGLTASDLLAIVVGRPRTLLSDLGLEDPGESPVLKLMGAASPSAKEQVEHARQRIHVDLAGWGAHAVDEGSLPQLQRAVWEDRLISLRYRASRSSFVIAPLGLVSKGGQWYLVASSKDEYRTYLVARMHDIDVLEERFERPTDFDLAAHWAQAGAEYRRTFSTYVATFRLRGDALTRLRWTYARSKKISEPDADGWVDAELDLETEEYALGTIRALGNELIVRGPAKLRRSAVADAQAFATANRDSRKD